MQQEHCKSLSRRLRDEAASHREEAALRDRAEREMQEQWEGTLEGLQREKTALIQRVQARHLRHLRRDTRSKIHALLLPEREYSSS